MGAKNEVGEFPGVNGRLPQGHNYSGELFPCPSLSWLASVLEPYIRIKIGRF